MCCPNSGLARLFSRQSPSCSVQHCPQTALKFNSWLLCRQQETPRRLCRALLFSICSASQLCEWDSCSTGRCLDARPWSLLCPAAGCRWCQSCWWPGGPVLRLYGGTDGVPGLACTDCKGRLNYTKVCGQPALILLSVIPSPNGIRRTLLRAWARVYQSTMKTTRTRGRKRCRWSP